MRQVAPQEITVGQKLTVLEWTSHKDNSWKGDILEVVHVELPYVICKFVTGSIPAGGIETFDTRGVVFGEPSELFVALTTENQNGAFIRGEVEEGEFHTTEKLRAEIEAVIKQAVDLARTEYEGQRDKFGYPKYTMRCEEIVAEILKEKER